MKTLNQFFEKTHMVIVYMTLSLMAFIIFFCMLHFIAEDLGTSSWITTLKCSFALSILAALPFTFLVGMSRKSTKFYDDAKILEEKIEKASTQKELEGLYDNDLKKLRYNAFGSPHYSECNKLKAVILTKAKYVK